MYDKHIICDDTLRNDGSNGFSFGARLPYYRGQPLSVVEDLVVTVDGETVPRDQVRLSLGDSTWALDELPALTTLRWEFGEVARVSVLRPGGLSVQPHEVALAVHLRISYLPFPSITKTTKTMTPATA